MGYIKNPNHKFLLSVLMWLFFLGVIIFLVCNVLPDLIQQPKSVVQEWREITEDERFINKENKPLVVYCKRVASYYCEVYIFQEEVIISFLNRSFYGYMYVENLLLLVNKKTTSLSSVIDWGNFLYPVPPKDVKIKNSDVYKRCWSHLDSLPTSINYATSLIND